MAQIPRIPKSYVVHGPFQVTRDDDDKFVADHSHDWESVVDKYGCYVYAVKFGDHLRPWYAGRTKRSFRQEIFTPHKQEKLALISKKFERGMLVVFIVAPAVGRGRPNLKYVREIEKYLISCCYEVNSDTVNIQDLPRTTWNIEEVTSSIRGRPRHNAAAAFCTMFDL